MRTQRELDTCVARMAVLTQRMTVIRIASSTLASLPPLAPEQRWLDLLTAWRKTLSDELAALPSPIRDSHTLGEQQNLMLSIQVIDVGLGVIRDSGFDLTTLRLGALMREAGYEPVDADPERHYSGVMPWFGSMPEVEQRIADLQQQRDAAQAQLDEALLDDNERERRAAEARARHDALNAAPVRKVRNDGSQFDRYPDGRRVEVTS
jgi:hypothetical protein